MNLKSSLILILWFLYRSILQPIWWFDPLTMIALHAEITSICIPTFTVSNARSLALHHLLMSMLVVSQVSLGQSHLLFCTGQLSLQNLDLTTVLGLPVRFTRHARVYLFLHACRIRVWYRPVLRVDLPFKLPAYIVQFLGQSLRSLPTHCVDDVLLFLF